MTATPQIAALPGMTPLGIKPRNQWEKLDLARSAQYGEEGLAGDIEKAFIRHEHSMSPDAEPCGFPGCKLTADYRPTVGSFMCADRHVLSMHGDWRQVR